VANEITIVVRARNEVGNLFGMIKRDAARAGGEAGDAITEQITEKIRVVRDDPALRESGAGIGETIGRSISERVSERVRVSVDETVRRSTDGRLRDAVGGGGTDREHVTVSERGREHVRVSVDVDKKSFVQQLRDALSGGSGFISDGLKTGFSAFFSGDAITGMLKSLGIAVAGILGAPAIGGALVAGIMTAVGGGAIAVGVAAAFKDPAIQGAAKDLKGRIQQVWMDFGQNFKPAVVKFLEGGLDVLKQMKPYIEDLGKVLGPVAEKLATGVIGFLQNFLPSVDRMAKASAPLIETLAGELPGIGDALGRMFDHISEGGPAANIFFNDLLNVIQLILPAIGKLIHLLAGLYVVVRPAITGVISLFLDLFGDILSGAAKAFGWVPGIGPKLRRAASEFRDFQQKASRALAGIKDRNVRVTVRAVWDSALGTAGQVANILSANGYAHGGIKGAANGSTSSGLTWVGEHGPELISAPPGSRIWSNPDSIRMAGAASGNSGTPLLVQLVLDGKQIASATVDPMRRFVAQNFGGDVQAALGKG
jgi:hypothetical protein